MGNTKSTANTIDIEDFKLFNDFPSGILILHLETKENPQDMRIVYGNSECRKLLGINTDDLPEKKIDTVLPELSERKIVQALTEVVFSQKAKDIKVISHKKKNNECFFSLFYQLNLGEQIHQGVCFFSSEVGILFEMILLNLDYLNISLSISTPRPLC